MLKMADAASRQALEELKKRLREFLEASDTGRQAMAMSANATSTASRRAEEYEMSSLNKGGKKAEEDEEEDI
jgi:protein SEY1